MKIICSALSTLRKRGDGLCGLACRLVPLLFGKVLKACSAMNEERAHCYVDLKAELLEKFDITLETYRQQFRFTAIPPGKNPT